MACFAVGAIPTGSSDPFALRRAALGIVKIILEHKLPLSISAAVSAAAKFLKENEPHIEASDAAQKQVLEFLLERARYILKERRGFAYDEINAAFAAGSDDLVDAVERVAALQAIRNTKNFAPLAASFKRIRNILREIAQARATERNGAVNSGAAAGASGAAASNGGPEDWRRRLRVTGKRGNIERHLRRFRSCVRRWISSSTKF